MHTDDVDDRVRHAATPDPAVVDRVVTAALGADVSGRDGFRWPAVAVAAVCLAAIVGIGGWWATRPSASPDGVYRAEALPPPETQRLEPAPAAAPDGVYRANASLEAAPARVIRITAGDGTTWILSTNASVDGLPRGSAVVIGGEEEK